MHAPFTVRGPSRDVLGFLLRVVVTVSAPGEVGLRDEMLPRAVPSPPILGRVRCVVAVTSARCEVRTLTSSRSGDSCLYSYSDCATCTVDVSSPTLPD